MDLSSNQGVLQSRQSLQLWLMVDGQLVVLTHRRHPVSIHIPLTGLAECVLFLSINFDFHIHSRFIADTVHDDVAVRWGRQLEVSILKVRSETEIS